MAPYMTEQEKLDRARFNENNARLQAIIKPLRPSTYLTDVDWRRIEGALQRYSEDWGGLELCPDFQRGHVWTEAQQVHYIENALRGIVPQTAFVIQFNCPNWNDEDFIGDLPKGFQCIDGLQRLTAIQKFMNGDVQPFGLSLTDLEFSSYSMKGCTYRFRLEIFDFTQKKDLLQHYLDFNTGGTPHSASEIERVKNMLRGV